MRTIRGAAVTLVLLVALVSCGINEKRGAAGTIVRLLGDANGRELTDTEKDCITELVMSFPEDDIRAIADRTADPATKERFDFGTFDCLSGLGS
jgi:hypothetical protein